MPGSSSASEASEAEAASSEERRRTAEGLGAAAALVRACLGPLPPASGYAQLAASIREPSGEGCAAAEKAAKEAAAPEAKRGAGGPLTEEAKAADAPEAAEEEAEAEAEE